MQNRQSVVSFGRTDGSANKTIFFKSRIRGLELANSLAFVFFSEHPYKSGAGREWEEVRYEGNGFYVRYKEEALVD